MQSEAKDWWDKAAIILQPVGGFLTALTVAYLGILGSQYLKHKETVETDTQLYADLLSKKQERDTAFRRDILKPAIDAVMSPRESIETRMLNMELLAANFQESLDLGPLFKRMSVQLYASTTPHKEEYVRRIERDAQEIKGRQLVALAGQEARRSFSVEDFRIHPEGIRVMDLDLRLHSDKMGDPQKRHFRVDVYSVDLINRAINVRMVVTTPSSPDVHVSDAHDGGVELDVLLWVGLFDFPLNDNFSLSHAQRCAVLLSQYDGKNAEITLAYFPESSEDPVQVLKRRLVETK